MSWFNPLTWFGGGRLTVTRNSSGTYEYYTENDGFAGQHNYLDLALSNVGLFTALDIRASIFSLGRIVVEDNDGNPIENDPFLELISDPNYSHSQQDFLYQTNFFKGTGNNITRVIATGNDPKNIEKVVSLENLVPSSINYNEINKEKKFVFAKSDINQIRDQHIIYSLDGTDIKIPVRELVFFYDITPGLCPNSRFFSPSRIKPLIPSISNIEQAQSSKSVNLKFSAKHIISSSVGDGMKEGLGAKEQKEIEDKTYAKDVIATEASLQVDSLANNISELGFDDGMAADELRIAGAYGINKDIINWYSTGASTHENQTASVVKFIQNVIGQEGEDWANTWESYFGYKKQGKNIKVYYDHLPIMQVLKTKKLEGIEKMVSIAQGLVELGITQDKALEMTGLNDLDNE